MGISDRTALTLLVTFLHNLTLSTWYTVMCQNATVYMHQPPVDVTNCIVGQQLHVVLFVILQGSCV